MSSTNPLKENDTYPLCKGFNIDYFNEILRRVKMFNLKYIKNTT